MNEKGIEKKLYPVFRAYIIIPIFIYGEELMNFIFPVAMNMMVMFPHV